ncbi:MAG: hypothetical protein JWN64_121 [Parcubacteria group bacterium]|nr:hypothetical protein [Parcubacteria group bacterium]
MWLVGSLKEEHRPDRWGVILDYWDIPGEQQKLVNIWEYIEGKLQSIEVQTIVEDLVATGVYVVAARPRSGKDQKLYFPAEMFESDKIRYVEAAVLALRNAEKQARSQA